MGYKTKIDWCDSSWNPVTGCAHNCPYCYAERMAKRFAGFDYDPTGDSVTMIDPRDKILRHEVDHMLFRTSDNGHKRSAPYPFGFEPTLHRYRLDQPSKWSEPRTIFVCSMADLFGEWVPLEWIREVFDACRKASQHRYIFLTKNPRRLQELEAMGELPDEPNFWYGSTVETYPDGPAENCWKALFIPRISKANTFVSIEPIMGDFEQQGITNNVDWVIVGAETGNRAGKVAPERRWIENLVNLCEIAETPLFMKDSLRELMGDDFKQEFPWEV